MCKRGLSLGILAAISASLSVVSAVTAAAADLPLKAPPKALVVERGGAYVWLDGSYQSIRLPTYNLGFQIETNLNQPVGPFESYEPRATGWGLTGAAGYLLPYGTLPAAFGSNARIELGASYRAADASQAGSAIVLNGTGGIYLPLLDGRIQTSSLCPGFDCQTGSTLTTNFHDWAINLKAASDFKSGAVTLTPSVRVFGGRARNDQTLSQQFSISINPVPLANYSASTSLRWTDWGGKVGLDAKVDVTNWLIVGVGGNVGWASRDVSLSANDACLNGVGAVFCNGFVGAAPISSITAGARATPLLANAEASLIVKPWSQVAIRGFAGLNYDSQVPGISVPTFTGTVNLPTSTAPAGIKFEHETSWYTGGGVVVKFGS